MWNTDKVLTVLNDNRDKPMQWFYENYSTMIQWCHRNGGIRKWKKMVGRQSRALLNEQTVIEIFENNKDKLDTWFSSNEPSVVQWCKRHGGWDYWIAKIGIQRKNKWNAVSVIAFLSANKEKPFDWFRDEKGLTSWCSSHGGWRKWAKEAGLKCKTNWNEQKVLSKLMENKEKDLMWFINNEQALVRWCYRHGGLKHWAELAGVI